MRAQNDALHTLASWFPSCKMLKLGALYPQAYEIDGAPVSNPSAAITSSFDEFMSCAGGLVAPLEPLAASADT